MVAVSLKKILEAFNFLSDEHASYVDPADGEVLTISDYERELLESDELPADLPEWQKQALDRLRSVDLDELLPLPTKFDIHEWDIMRRFALSVGAEGQSDALLDAIHGSGAFRNFRREVERLRLRDAWFAYRDAALQQIARDWITEHGLRCVDDAG